MGIHIKKFYKSENNSFYGVLYKILLYKFLTIFSLLGGQFFAHVTVRGKSKRMAIFNFLASCKSEELDIFFKVIFKSILNLIGNFC